MIVSLSLHTHTQERERERETERQTERQRERDSSPFWSWCAHQLNFKLITYQTFPKAVFPVAKLSMIMPATTPSKSHYCTCLNHLGRQDRDRIASIFVAPPNVATASTILTVTSIDIYVRVSLSPAFSP
jgi:hypothetical protein